MIVDADTPLVLADGTKINPATGKAVKERQHKQRFVEIPSASEAQAIVSKTRRSVVDLPLPAQQMNSISLVLFYMMWGLSVNDTAIVMGISAQQVKNIQALPQFKQLTQQLQEGVLAHETDNIREFFQKRAVDAAEKIVDIMEEDDGVLGFKAAQDILDRAGHRPADIVEHRHTMENALHIEYVSKKPVNDIPVVDTTFEVINDGNRS